MKLYPCINFKNFPFCPQKCDYMTKVENDYRTHLKDEHSLTPEDLEDEQGVRVPRVNSQGKVKTFKCKQCEYVTVTKEEFWKHCKGHIKPEKLLTCPKCSFVTEYKHHLEYHLRNHFGSKPFKCPSCSYSCVNKSMLNSHMKSHTTLYQYRCADCNYATKYCHSLKLHLRKYAHKPAMVLNPDGTPNPLPIVDVYGTRRGPKIKRDEHGNVIGPPQALGHQQGDTPPGSGSSIPGSPRSGGGFPLLPPYVMAQMKMHQLQQSFPPFGPGGEHHFPGLSRHHHEDIEHDDEIMDDEEDDSRHLEGSKFQLKCTICDFETVDRNIYRNHMMLHASRDKEDDSPQPSPNSALSSSVTTLPRHNMGMNFSMSNEIKKERRESESENNNPTTITSVARPPSHDPEDYLPKSTSTPSDYFEYLKRMAPLIKRSAEMHPSPSGQISSTQDAPNSPPHHPFLPGSGNGGGLLSRLYLGTVVKNFQQREASGDADSNASSGGALDLSQGYDMKSLDVDHADNSGRSSSGNGSSKSRRKGRAYKIERKLDSLSGGGDSSSIHSGVSSEPEDAKSEESGPGVISPPCKEPEKTNGSYCKRDKNDNGSPDALKSDMESKLLSGSHVCELCQIAFMDAYMYSYHKDCHDRLNPLKCVKCGAVMPDARGFFLHLIRESHQ